MVFQSVGIPPGIYPTNLFANFLSMVSVIVILLFTEPSSAGDEPLWNKLDQNVAIIFDSSKSGI